MTKDELIEFLCENLRLELDRTGDYTGDVDSPRYEARLVIRLVLDGETISEVTT